MRPSGRFADLLSEAHQGGQRTQLQRFKDGLLQNRMLFGLWRLARRVVSHWLVLRAKRANRLEILFLNGMKRSGIHFFMSLVVRGTSQNVLFCNDVGRNQFPLDPIWGQELYLRGLLAKDLILIIGYEDYSVHDFRETIEKHRKALNVVDGDHRAVVIVRDPFNSFASRWHLNHAIGREFRTDAEYRQKIQELWIDHASGLLDSGRGQSTGELIFVDYNRLVVDMEYRASVSRAIGLPLYRGHLSHVSNFGWGSSFTGTDTLLNPEVVLRRWEALSTSEDFLDLFNDRLVALAASLYSQVYQEFRGKVAQSGGTAASEGNP